MKWFVGGVLYLCAYILETVVVTGVQGVPYILTTMILMLFLMPSHYTLFAYATGAMVYASMTYLSIIDTALVLALTTLTILLIKRYVLTQLSLFSTLGVLLATLFLTFNLFSFHTILLEMIGLKEISIPFTLQYVLNALKYSGFGAIIGGVSFFILSKYTKLLNTAFIKS